jgi:glycosyltransferase involved in cell wall biosynthesis
MIDILLATYNGEKYLKQQLDSLINQTFQKFRIIVRDDGSKDNTLRILNTYKAEFENKFIIINDDFGNLGSTKCFMKLLEYSNNKYIMFCDQDDFWLPNKVEISLNKIKLLGKNQSEFKPLLVFTDLTLVDENLIEFEKSLWKYQKLNTHISNNWRHLAAQNVITGCTIIMNRAAKEVSLPFPAMFNEMIHDQWIGINVSKFGEINFLKQSTILYRQHSSNLEGSHNFSFGYIKDKLFHLSKVLLYFNNLSIYFVDISVYSLILYKIKLNVKRIFAK